MSKTRATRVLPSSRRVLLENLEVRTLLSAAPWNLAARLIRQDVAVSKYPQLTGAGESIVLIDSGVDYLHPALGGGLGPDFKVQAGWDFMDNDANPMCDTFAHGTAVAGVAAADPFDYNGAHYQGIAPGARLIVLRESNSSQVESAMQWVLANRAKYNIVAVNYTDYGGPWGTIYKDELNALNDAGVFVSHPTGNNGATLPAGAALSPGDAAVGSIMAGSGQVSSFTQRGPNLDLVAPGENVTVTYYDVATKANTVVEDTWGTSWASPVATGAAALIKQLYSGFTPAQIIQILKDSGVSTWDPTTQMSYKRIDLAAALDLAVQRVPQAPAASGPTPVPAAPAPTPTPSAPVPSPFSGSVISLDGTTTVQAEDFDAGGEGVSYHDGDGVNTLGSAYRCGAGVDVRDLGAGGRSVGTTWAGEWLEYTVNLPAAGSFNLSARVAAYGAGGTFHFKVDGQDATSPIAIPDTGGWQNFTNVDGGSVSLSAGTHVLRIRIDSTGVRGLAGDIDSFTLTPAGSPAPAPAPAPTPTPAPAPAPTPAPPEITDARRFVPADNYTAQLGVQDMGWYVGSTDQGDWIGYRKMDFGTGATIFTASVSADASSAGKKIQIRQGSATGTILGVLTLSPTGGTTNFKAQSTSISRVSGVQDVYLTFAGGANVASLQWMRFA